MTTTKAYFGDGVYAEVIDDGDAIKLTTENGISVTNTIVLEHEVFHSLLAYLSASRRAARGEK